MSVSRIATVALLSAAPAVSALAQSDADLAAALANPVAALISVPFQNNLDFGGGTGDALRYTLNIQPVVPVTLTSDWNLIVRTILPVMYNERVYSDHRSGLGDVTQSFFFSPSQPVNGITWGVGPAMLYPTGTDGLGQRQWGAGPTGVVLRQSGPWIFGALVNHIFGLGGAPDGTEAVNTTFLQPFVNYVTPSQTTFFLNTESTYDWSRQQWTAPINAGVNQLDTIETLRAMADAQQDYARTAGRQGGLRAYARRFFSTPGRRDGLYWPSAEGEPESPLGPLAAAASAGGYGRAQRGDRPEPYHGYVYRILERQGPAAPGGAMDYVVNGRMIGGFAIIASPARYGSTGIKTFMISHDDVVWEQDLGPATARAAAEMEAFNPDEDWQRVPE